MYDDILWLRLLAKYFIHKFDVTRIQADSCIFYRKYDEVKFNILISVHIYVVFMSGRTKTL